jgi:hypothetical protein
MSTEIEKKITITVIFNVPTFKWYQMIRIEGVKTMYDESCTIEISPEAAKKILNELSYTTSAILSDTIDFVVQ